VNTSCKEKDEIKWKHNYLSSVRKAANTFRREAPKQREGKILEGGYSHYNIL